METAEGLALFFLQAFLVMLTLGGLHDAVSSVPAMGYWLTVGTLVTLRVLADRLRRR